MSSQNPRQIQWSNRGEPTRTTNWTSYNRNSQPNFQSRPQPRPENRNTFVSQEKTLNTLASTVSELTKKIENLKD